MKTFTISFFIVLCTLFIFHLNGEAQVIHVPADYSTIQEGIIGAEPGDTVLVSDGLYYENISFLGKKPLLVTSMYAMDSDTNHINNTIIDGSQFSDIDNASVVAFKSGEDTTSILCGFTIRGGMGTWDSVRNNRCGGGVYISGSGARIIYNKVSENRVDDTQEGNGQETYGGGIGTSYEDADYWIVISHNAIYDNTAVTKYGQAAGGGIYDSYNARVEGNVIAGNYSLATTDGWGSGGGFSSNGFDGGDPVTLIIRNNRFQKNKAESVLFLGVDGAATTVNAHLTFTGNEVIDNTGITGVDWGGGLGGLSVINPASGCNVTGNMFRENHGTIDGGAIILENYEQAPDPEMVMISDNYFLFNEGTYGGALRSNDIPVLFENNVFNGNKAAKSGGAIYVERWYDHSDDHLITLINNSFSGNFAQNYGGAIWSNKFMPLILNCVFYRDSTTSGIWEEIYQYYNLDTVDLAYSNIDQSQINGKIYDGGGSIYADPVFHDQELLTPENGSSCRDAGTTSYVCHHGYTHSSPDHDLLGAIRPQGGTVDIGAYELMPLAVEDPSSEELSNWLQISPNPTKGIVDCRLTIGDWRNVVLKIYDGLGREVATVLDGPCTGDQVVRWDATGLPAGMYLVRLQAGAEVVTEKMVVMR
jgi:hypothetical protein